MSHFLIIIFDGENSRCRLSSFDWRLSQDNNSCQNKLIKCQGFS